MKQLLIGIISIISVILIIVIISSYLEIKETVDYQSIKSVNNDIDDELEIYFEKFIRDLNYYNIFIKLPTNVIIKFSYLESYENTKDKHGVSLGYNDDEKIEIYINKSSWEKFNKPQKYHIIYHELGHDILNLEDLDASNNEHEIMFESMSEYDSYKMNDFIIGMEKMFKSYK